MPDKKIFPRRETDFHRSIIFLLHGSFSTKKAIFAKRIRLFFVIS